MIVGTYDAFVVRSVLGLDTENKLIASIQLQVPSANLTTWVTSPPDSITRWLTELITALSIIDYACIPAGWHCLAKFDSGKLTYLGSGSGNQWMKVHEPSPPPGAPSAVTKALAHINRHRHSYGNRPLDPVAAGWTDAEVIDHASELGWSA